MTTGADGGYAVSSLDEIGEGYGFRKMTVQRLSAGGVARVAPETVRGLQNVGAGDAVVVVIGGKDGYVGRDGRTGEGDASQVPPGAA